GAEGASGRCRGCEAPCRNRRTIQEGQELKRLKRDREVHCGGGNPSHQGPAEGRARRNSEQHAAAASELRSPVDNYPRVLLRAEKACPGEHRGRGEIPARPDWRPEK